MSKIISWLVYSSANADKLGASFKGALGVIVALVTNIIIFGHFNIDPASVSDLANTTLIVFQDAFATISALYAAYGIVRKVWTTMQGTNAVLNSTQPSN